MKKRIKVYLAVMFFVVLSMSGCIFEKTCKEPDCSETKIYKDGYCKYHYAKHFANDIIDEGEDVLKNWVNGD